MNSAYSYFAALICATDTEEAALLRMFDWERVSIPGDRQVYYETEISRDDGILKIAAARQEAMGMVCTTALSMKLIEHYRPMYLIMPGILAGETDAKYAQFFGDIILADTVWDYANGKYVSKELSECSFGPVGFISRPISIQIPRSLSALLRKIVEEDENEFILQMGTIACGNCVVANKEISRKMISSQRSDTLGLDMESYGAVYAAMNCTEPRPYPIIAKSVCDFADETKNDHYQQFAAFNSCQFVKHLLTRTLPLCLEESPAEVP